ncbi:MAG: hypothetical protein COV44_05480 [Deltaproteobacteria bacterium CG11_big_fil_rev_8_21_14_0_20_45_16]|nr:MAG: hypothetical protein COV44_05480 [Deltaproteobacteria bacterium CG11_big_fil_rev_8_21_14_0_20_45_16]
MKTQHENKTNLPEGVFLYNLDTPLAFAALTRFSQSIIEDRFKAKFILFQISESAQPTLGEIRLLSSVIKDLKKHEIQSGAIVSPLYWSLLTKKHRMSEFSGFYIFESKESAVHQMWQWYRN